MGKQTESISGLLLAFTGALGIAFAFYAIYHSLLPKQPIPIGVFAIIAGVIFESRRLSGRWWTVLVNVLFSLVGSVCFLWEDDKSFLGEPPSSLHIGLF
jgi:hypothetical protein